MNTITKTAIVALVTAAIGFSAIAPSFAQDAAPAQQQGFRQDGPGAHRGGNHAGPGRGGIINFLGNGNAVEAVEIALVRLSHAIELTTEQQALFDTLKTDALAAAQAFETATEGLRPQNGPAPAEGATAARPDMSAMLENRIAMETAHLAALEAVQPSLSAFFDSLTDEQKAQLMPERGGKPGQGGPRHHQGGAAPQGEAAPAPANG